ncbi:MAG TPA: ABC transporter permease [Desulfuromonas sp.]|nr:ABC transporter permease [Desulfuromonas sp.]
MGKLFGVIHKELLQLSRDRAGLLVLFVMPAALVLIMSLVQNSVLKATGEAAIDVLWVDEDGSPFAREVADQLATSGAIELIRELDGAPLTASTARAAVAAGDYQFAVVLPAGMGQQLLARAHQQAREALGSKEREVPVTVPLPLLLVDPAVQTTFHAAVANALQRVLLGLEIRQRTQVFEAVLPGALQQAISKAAGPFFALGGGTVPTIKVTLSGEATLNLQQEVAVAGRSLLKPNAVQHNVPAWTLFAMFFIVVPLSGMVIRERQNGTLQRLMAMPVSPLTVLGGRVVAYLGVGLLQFFFMLAVGFWILPLFGTPALVVGGQWPALLVVAVAATLAATSYGLLLGTVASTYEQASMFGAVSVVIAAAMGGIMMPLYVMPRLMQQASILSPLNWGLEAFQTLLVRSGTLADIAPQVVALLTLFAANMLAAWYFLHHNRKRPA